jgi:hypothetical protein
MNTFLPVCDILDMLSKLKNDIGFDDEGSVKLARVLGKVDMLNTVLDKITEMAGMKDGAKK